MKSKQQLKLPEGFGLYVHIPFCSSFCDYCDFFSVAANDDTLIDAFLNAVIKDIKYQIDYFSVKKISTVYIGGGTPSVLGQKIEILLDALNSLSCFSPVEFTVEANPESVNEKFLSVCRQGGVNRLSLGVQTFHEPSRLAVNRAGNRTDLVESLSAASGYFPGALSADLITGLPFQNEKVVQSDIELLLSFSPVHVSLYSLTLENNTQLEEKIKNKTVILPDCETADSIWLSGRESLINAGFCHYEVSNFALSGKVCLHNMRYWQMQNWLGIGPGASGTIINSDECNAARFTYNCDVDVYIKKPLIHCAVYEELGRAALLRETLLMGFRCKEGFDSQLFQKRFGCNIEDCIPQTLERWKDREIMLFLNSFLQEAFNELDRH